jgi:hypothetical protein
MDLHSKKLSALALCAQSPQCPSTFGSEPLRGAKDRAKKNTVLGSCTTDQLESLLDTYLLKVQVASIKVIRCSC